MADKNKEYMPRLRFPEFRGPTTWEISPLSKMIKTIIPPKKILTQEYEKGGKIPIIDQSKEKIAGYTNDLSSVIKINKPAIVFGDHTCIIKYIDFDFAQGADGIKIIDPINIIPRYLFEYLCYFPVNPTGYSRHFSILKEKSIGFPPSIKEQQKIADCLSSLDELIEAHEQKRDALVEHKKGLMQRLFPAEGENTPRWRFPEFRKVGEWKKYKVGDLFTATRGEVLAMSKVQESRTDACPYPVYSSQTKNNGLAGFYSTYLYEDAITWTTDGANAGDVNYREGKFFCTNVCGVLLSKDGYCNKCVAEIINSISRKHVSYVGNPKLMNNVMKEIEIYIPSIAEQQKIADCLSSLDARIEAQEAKIASLREHKRGLMQRLFPQSL